MTSTEIPARTAGRARTLAPRTVVDPLAFRPSSAHPDTAPRRAERAAGELGFQFRSDAAGDQDDLQTVAPSLVDRVHRLCRQPDHGGELPKERRFDFHITDGKPIASAATMHEFQTAVRHLDQEALLYHLDRRDVSRWLDTTIADKNLAVRMAVWEDELQAHRAADLERIRHEVIKAVEERYLPNHESR